MDTYEKKLKEHEKIRVSVRSEEEAFLDEFKRLRADVIRPAMEEIGNQLEARGHEVAISEREESTDSRGRTEDAKITMSFFPSDVERSVFRPDCTPSISFLTIGYKRKIRIHASNIMPNRGGSGGPRGEFDTAEITGDFVEAQVLKLLKEIFGEK